MMNSLTIIGISAGFCTTACLIPQVVQIHKSKQTRDISLNMYLVFAIGVILWLFYGIFINDIPVIIANALTLPMAIYVLVMKIKHQ